MKPTSSLNLSDKQKIKVIGKKGVCTEDELYFFLPNYPTLRGSESIFRISWANANRYHDNEIEYFIKGLHYIELKYREMTKHDSGFGSPSPTNKLIESLKDKNQELSAELEQWIIENGGNYYLKSWT